jgi:hypothetical protein
MTLGQWDFLLPGAMDMVRCIKPRDQIAAIKIGVVSRQFEPDICDAVIGCMDYIDSTLRNARNRYVHDLFSMSDQSEKAIRTSLAPKDMTTDDGQYRFIQPGQMEYISIPDTRELIEDIIDERRYLLGLISVTKWPPDCGHREQLPEPPLRLLAQRKREKQSKMDKARSALKRQHRPS